jgi:thiol-disulfide isomerase/thioredoxin
LLLGAGLLAAAAGGGFAWWQSKQAGAGLPTEPFAGFWALQWDAPQGGPVLMQSFRGKPLLINFWATWCPPCIEELPLINDFFNKNKVNGWHVLGLAIDRPDAVKGFLQKMPLDFPVGLAGATGSELAGKLGNPTGSLPFSVAIGAEGSILQRKLGRLKPEDLNLWAQLK